MKRTKEDQLIEQALTIAFQERMRAYEQVEVPPPSPDFKARIMAQYRAYSEAEAQNAARRRAAAVRRWTCAAAALMVVGIIGLSLPTIQGAVQYWLRVRADHPEVSYTISQMPEVCTQVYHQTSSCMAYTQWETAHNDRIVLLQEEASPEALLEHKDYRQKAVRTEEITGTLYIGADHTVLIWKNDSYYFLLMMDGALTDEDLMFRTAASLVQTKT